MTHLDKDCTWFFAAHFGGRKQWTIREWHIGATAGEKKVPLGEFFDGKERFQAEVQAGEVLLWPPWLPHAARVLDEATYSINGRVQLITGEERPPRIRQRALEAKHLAQPPACQGTQEQEAKYVFGDNMAEAEAREAEMMPMEEATRGSGGGGAPAEPPGEL